MVEVTLIEIFMGMGGIVALITLGAAYFINKITSKIISEMRTMLAPFPTSETFVRELSYLREGIGRVENKLTITPPHPPSTNNHISEVPPRVAATSSLRDN